MATNVTLRQWRRSLERSKARLDAELVGAVALTAQAAAVTARGMVGHEQPGITVATPPLHFPAWDPLAVSTIDDKILLGFTAPDYQPLRRTGELQQSIEGVSSGLVGAVGSTDPKAVFSEAGTSKEPPRLVFAPAVALNLELLSDRLGAIAMRALIPGRR